jgi:hypothetical protein
MIQTVLEALQFHVTKSLDLSLESVDYAEIITPLVFLAGDWTEVGPLWTTLREKHQLVAFLNLGSKPDLDTGQWSLVSHVEHDGVTDGRWWCGTSFLVEQWNKVTSSSPRRLCHILSPLPRGCPFKPISDINRDDVDRVLWLQGFCHPAGLLPASKPQVEVLAPSVFTKWTTRRLTLKELLDCWDIPESAMKKFSQLPIEPSQFAKLPFIGVTPAKVLYGVLICLLPWLNPECQLGQSVAAQHISDAPHPTQSLPQVLSSFPEQVLDGSTSLRGEISTRQRAAKDDDAAIPFHLWDEPFWLFFTVLGRTTAFISETSRLCSTKRQTPILEVLRSFILCVWIRSVYRSFRRFMIQEHGAQWYHSVGPDIEAGRECLHRIALCTFWEWEGGSKLLFWRWPAPIRRWARDGHPIYISGELPQYRRRQPLEPNPTIREQVRHKLAKFVQKGYVKPGTVHSLISFFTVPKGESDVRIVFDGTKSGLNAALWAPSFHLPTIDSLLPALQPGYWQSDIDVSEQFYNFCLDPLVRMYCGLDVTHYLEHSPGKTMWLSWDRCVMGLKSSPHGCIKMQSLGEEVVRGDPSDPLNPFYFDQIRLNLPGQPYYDPRLARASKIDSRSGQTAGDLLTYVDDTRTSGYSQAHCWSVSHRVSTHLCYLGIQDALRKRTAPSQLAGAWTGSIAQSPPEGVTVSCTQEKWTRARSYVADMLTTLSQGLPFTHKDLEQKRGFLVYVTRTYPSLTPFLKGIHLTLDSWRPGRDQDGWKIQAQLSAHLDEAVPILSTPPLHVLAVPRLEADLQALTRLMCSPIPPLRIIRSSTVMLAFYGFGDASGSGFGSTFTGHNGTSYRYGLWGSDLQGASSNYRELFNLTEAAEAHVQELEFSHLQHLVDSVAREARVSPLQGAEFFLFTDNGVAEAAFYKGTSSNPRLFDLVVRLKQLELSHCFTIQLIHISGLRMQAQGTDGLSRGDLLGGVMAGHDLMEFIPLHLTAYQRSPGILAWVSSWLLPSHSLVHLQPLDWYGLGHGITSWHKNADGVPIPHSALSPDSVLLWTPAPAAANAAVEQLSFSRLKRPCLTHVFVVPRLMTHLWRKQLFKLADLVFSMPAGFRLDTWPSNMFEPLIVGVILPYLPAFPWSRRHTDSVLEVGRALSGVFSALQGDECSVLRQLWREAGGGMSAVIGFGVGLATFPIPPTSST